MLIETPPICKEEEEEPSVVISSRILRLLTAKSKVATERVYANCSHRQESGGNVPTRTRNSARSTTVRIRIEDEMDDSKQTQSTQKDASKESAGGGGAAAATGTAPEPVETMDESPESFEGTKVTDNHGPDDNNDDDGKDVTTGSEKNPADKNSRRGTKRKAVEDEDGDDATGYDDVKKIASSSTTRSAGSGSTNKETGKKIRVQSTIEPEEDDVLCGRGRPFQSWPGNLRLHEIVNRYKAQYVQSRRYDKLAIAERVLHEIKHGVGDMKSGRFLRKGKGEDDTWEIASDTVAREKVSHALRGKPKRSSYMVMDQLPSFPALEGQMAGITRGMGFGGIQQGQAGSAGVSFGSLLSNTFSNDFNASLSLPFSLQDSITGSAIQNLYRDQEQTLSDRLEQIRRFRSSLGVGDLPQDPNAPSGLQEEQVRQQQQQLLLLERQQALLRDQESRTANFLFNPSLASSTSNNVLALGSHPSQSTSSLPTPSLLQAMLALQQQQQEQQPMWGLSQTFNNDPVAIGSHPSLSTSSLPTPSLLQAMLALQQQQQQQQQQQELSMRGLSQTLNNDQVAVGSHPSLSTASIPTSSLLQAMLALQQQQQEQEQPMLGVSQTLNNDPASQSLTLQEALGSGTVGGGFGMYNLSSNFNQWAQNQNLSIMQSDYNNAVTTTNGQLALGMLQGSQSGQGDTRGVKTSTANGSEESSLEDELRRHLSKRRRP